MSAVAAVQVRSLTKRIGNKTIVQDLSFDVPRGEVFGFLGPNGAGKTTTIRMIVGLMSITKGQVLINGIDVEQDFEGAMRHIGAIVENPEMYKFLTGYQNLVHYMRMVPDVPVHRIQEVASLVGLEHRIHDKVKTYSLGMRQRLGLAQALLHNPSVLILDEPTNGLDPAGIRELRDHLRNLAEKEGIAVIVSSHLLSEMELMCDRVAIIQHGKLVTVKTLHEMVSVNQEQASLIMFEVDEPEQANAVLAQRMPGAAASLQEAGLTAMLTREQIAEANAILVHSGHKVYAIRAYTQSLEDKFLEITGGGGIV